MRFNAACSEWLAIIPMIVKAITSEQAMVFVLVCVGVSPAELTISRFIDLRDDADQVRV